MEEEGNWRKGMKIVKEEWEEEDKWRKGRTSGIEVREEECKWRKGKKRVNGGKEGQGV